jgi:hypothetical protein
VSGWEAIGGVFQLTRHWSGLLGGDQREARVGLPPLNCAVSLPSLRLGRWLEEHLLTFSGGVFSRLVASNHY